MPTETHRLQLDHPDFVRRIGEHLRQADYAETAVCVRLELDTLPVNRTRRQRLPFFLQRTRIGDALDTLIRLFFLQQPVFVDAARHAVAPMDLCDWQDAGLLHLIDDKFTASVEIYPFSEIILATDWPSPPGANADEVMSVSASSRLLAQMTVRRRSARTLDLGAGCGIQSILAASHSDHVTAVDCNPRAIAFGEFNAQLNGCDNMTFKTGNFFEPVAGQTFDLIVSCPPFVISPRVDYVHTHNDMPADELCRTIVKAAPAFLNDGGYCQVIGNWAQFVGQDWRDRLADLCREIQCDAVLMYSHSEDVATYAFERILEMGDDVSQFDKWLEYFQDLKIGAVGFGLLTIRRKRHSTSWFHAEQMRPNQDGGIIERQFAVRDFLESHRDDRALLYSRLRVSARLRLNQQLELTNREWSLVETKIRNDNESINVGPEVLEFLKHCDGKQSVLKCFHAAAPDTGKNISPPPGFLTVVRRLVEKGFLVEE